jgi:hypothetical protein
MQAIRLQQTVQQNGELFFSQLPVVKGQLIEVLLLVPPPVKPKKRLTARSLLDSGLLGLWKDRTDIEDSAEYARQLRQQSQQRGGGGQ